MFRERHDGKLFQVEVNALRPTELRGCLLKLINEVSKKEVYDDEIVNGKNRGLGAAVVLPNGIR